MIDILFVDDEPNILDGLRRTLRTMRHEWQMFFAVGGAEALNIISEKNIDVVVTDMKMPGMDGSQLLQKISGQYPHIVRIILSGYAEKETIMKSVGVAHQYLSKPCDSEMLRETVNRACALRNLLVDEKLRRLVSQLNSIPSLPALYQELVKELNQPDPQMRRISEIVQTDIGMTVKILQIVNSAFFGLRRSIADASEAVRFLGLDTVKALALGIGVFSQFESSSSNLLPEHFVPDLWRHSLEVALTAKSIARSENAPVSGDAFTAGLLHEIGKIILAVNLPEEFVILHELMEKEKIDYTEAEKRVFETTHANVGGYLVSLWGLPDHIVEAVAFHRKPRECQKDLFTPLTAVHVADISIHYKDKDICAAPEKYFDVEYLKNLGLLEKIAAWQENCVNQV